MTKKTLIVTFAALALAGGCKKKDKDAENTAKPTTGSDKPMTGSDKPPPPPPPAKFAGGEAAALRRRTVLRQREARGHRSSRGQPSLQNIPAVLTPTTTVRSSTHDAHHSFRSSPHGFRADLPPHVCRCRHSVINWISDSWSATISWASLRSCGSLPKLSSTLAMSIAA